MSLFAVIKIWLFPRFKRSVFLRAPALNLVNRQVPWWNGRRSNLSLRTFSARSVRRKGNFHGACKGNFSFQVEITRCFSTSRIPLCTFDYLLNFMRHDFVCNTLLASSSVQIKMIISTNIHLRKKNNFQFINERDATIDTFNKILLQEFVINTMSSWFNENTWLIFLNSQHVSFLILTTIIFIPFFPFHT